MVRWARVIRGMVGTGLTFATGVVLVAGVVGSVAMLAGELSGVGLMRIVGRLSVVAFLVGVAFSGVFAMVARGRTLETLSLRLVTALGAGAGLLYFLAISLNAYKVWTVSAAFMNLTILTLLGACSAAGTLILARKAGRVFRSGEDTQALHGDETRSLGEANIDVPVAERETGNVSRL